MNQRKQIGRLCMAALALSWPGLSWADGTVINTALFQFRDQLNVLHSGVSNSVTVLIVNNSIVLPPTLHGFNPPVPSQVTPSTVFNLNVEGTGPFTFAWVFTLTDNPSGAPPSSVAARGGAGGSTLRVSTFSPSLALSSVPQLHFGTWHVAVTASNAAGVSAPGSADFMMVGDGSNVRVYPNPWRLDQHPGSPIKWDGLAAGSTVKIYTVSGHWVKSLDAPAGIASWNLTNDAGELAASGLYLYVITTPDGQHSKGKLAIVR